MTKSPDPRRTVSTRDRIVDAATSLFWRHGYHPVSTDAICQAASVRKGSLYHAFAKKEDVLAACLDDVWGQDWRDVQAIYSGYGTPTEQLRAHLQWFECSQRQLKARHGMVLGNFHTALGVSIPDLVMKAMQERRAEHSARIKRSIIEVLGLTAADEAHATWLTDITAELISGTMLRARLSDDLAPLEKMPETILRLIHAVPRPAA